MAAICIGIICTMNNSLFTITTLNNIKLQDNQKYWETLTPEDKIIKIAELCGWTTFKSRQVHGEIVLYGWHHTLHNPTIHKYETPLPKYLTDLNAMYQAEEQRIYCTGGDREGRIIQFESLLQEVEHAPAEIHAKAFYLTLQLLEYP